MRKPWRVLLSLIVGFNLVFWLMVLNGYQLSGSFWRLDATPIVGSVAVVLLSACIVRVKQPASYRFFGITRSPWHARLLLVFLPILFLPISCLPLALWFVLLVVYAVLSNVWPLIDWHQSLFVVGSLLGIGSSYIALVFFFDWVVSVLNQAALRKSVKRVVYALQAIGLMLVLTALVGMFHILTEQDPLCSQRYASPSGQRAIVIEGYLDSSEHSYEAGGLTSRAYLDTPVFRKDLSAFSDVGLACKEDFLTLKWSADERQVDWQISKYRQGTLRF